MYLNVNVIFIILSYHCFTVYARFSPLDFNFDPGFYGRRKGKLLFINIFLFDIEE